MVSEDERKVLAGIPTISIGSSSKTARVADEVVEIGELIDTEKDLALANMRWCGVSDGQVDPSHTDAMPTGRVP
jgi:hypothetical protein